MRSDLQIPVEAYQAFKAVQFTVPNHRMAFHLQDLDQFHLVQLVKEGFFQGMTPAKMGLSMPASMQRSRK